MESTIVMPEVPRDNFSEFLRQLSKDLDVRSYGFIYACYLLGVRGYKSIPDRTVWEISESDATAMQKCVQQYFSLVDSAPGDLETARLTIL